jgi:hypothetical protein
MVLEAPISCKTIKNENYEYRIQMTPEYIRSFRLEKYEIICSHCGGIGYILGGPESKHGNQVCNMCKGKLKLNWLEQVFGVQNNK